MLNKTALVVGGVLAGFINGFLGGGGGVVIVSLLLAVLKLDQKKSQSTALLIILPLTVVSAAVYLICGNVDWHTVLWTTLGVVAGGVLGALLLKRLQGNAVKMIFAVILVLGGIKMFF